MSNPLNIDMTRGAIVGKIVLFVLPLTVLALLQLFSNSIDMIVSGRYLGHISFAAIAVSNSITALLLIFIGGIAVGAMVTAAQYRGAGDDAGVNRTVHTSLILALAIGLFFMAAVLILAHPLMRMLNTPSEIIDRAVLYLRIHSLGIPFAAIGTVGFTLMFAVGDSLLPLLVAALAGVVKVGLELLFVIIFKWDVAGAAVATVLSQMLTTLTVLAILTFVGGSERIVWNRIGGHFKELGLILLVGAPVILSESCVYLSRIMIQRVVNGFGVYAMAGNVVAERLEWMMGLTVLAMCRTATVFAAQNYGAGAHCRVLKGVLTSAGLLTLVIAVLSILGLVCGTQLVLPFNSSPEFVQQAMARLHLTLPAYFLLGLAETAAGGLRGMRWSLIPAGAAILGMCVLPIVWIAAVLPKYNTLTSLYIYYPISWALVATLNWVMFLAILFIASQWAAEKRLAGPPVGEP